MLRLVTVIGVLGGASVAIAEPVRMTNADIQRAMPGALLEIDTPLRIAIPVKVGTDGLMSAEAGALGLTLGATKDRGRWWTEGDKLCMKWFRWFDARPRCMTLHREGNRVQWAEGSGESGTATITEATPVVAAAAPPYKPKPDRRTPASTGQPEENSANTGAADEARNADAPPRFATAALDKIFAPQPREAEPLMLGMGDEPGSRTAVNETMEQPPQATEPPPTTHKQHAKAPAAAQTVRKSARRAPSAQAAKPSPAPAAFRVAGVRSGDKLNVRSGPSEYHPPVGTIPSEGRGVQIIGACRDLWCPVRHGRLTGWVNRFYLAEDAVQRTSARR